MASPNSNLPKEESRNWLELPRDVTMTILMKLGAIEILDTTQFVCRSWHSLCKDPSMWRKIDMENIGDPDLREMYEKMTYNAVDRSCGGLVEIHIQYFGNDDLLNFIADRSSRLKSLRLACCYWITDEGFTEAIKKLPLLEEVELTLCTFSAEEIKAVGLGCPFLKTFKLNHQGSRDPNFADDEEALVIAETMPRLCHLQLIGNGLTSTGLEAIVNGCRHLESLDLRACFHVHLAGSLGKRCTEQIKHFRQPRDSTDDYKFVTTTDYDSDYESYDHGIDDIDFLSDDDDYYEFSADSELPDYEDVFDYD
ncbi:hypothetical protein Nepgr_022651 [Nepenthes gracilis]|uniref:F-box domain-containing protein n=1 Tax=Nepenthes gracilis TaxID=150966 RepID=A0AAD3T1E9_NEPGR|nr:hypothetical protein Nepgr_022651 [Nepenthes gracilis]